MDRIKAFAKDHHVAIIVTTVALAGIASLAYYYKTLPTPEQIARMEADFEAAMKLAEELDRKG